MAKETLRIELKVDGAAQATAATKQVQTGIVSLSGTVERAGATLLQMRAILTGLAVGGLGALVRSTVNAADELSKLSTRLDISVESLSQLEFAADRSGVSFDAMTTALQRQTRRISEAAKGTGEAVKAFQELGLSAEKLNTLKPDQQFEVLADALAGVADGGDRVRLAMKFWDSEGVKLLQVAEGGAAGVRKLREESDRLGRTISTDTAKAAADFNDELTNLKGSFDALIWRFLGGKDGLIAWLARAAEELNKYTIPAFRNWAAGILGVNQEIARMTLPEVNEQITLLSRKMRDNNIQLMENKRALNVLNAEYAKRKNINEEELDILDRVKKRGEAERKTKQELEKQYMALSARKRELIAITDRELPQLDDYKGRTDSATRSTGDLDKATESLKNTMEDYYDVLSDVNASADAIFEALDAQEIDMINERWMQATFSAKAAAKEAGEEIRTEFGRTGDWMAQSLTDAIMRGFEDGAGFVANFIQTLKNWFSTLVLRPIIQPIASSAVGALGFGSAGTANATGMGGYGNLMNFSSFMGGSSIANTLNSGAAYFGFGPTGIPSATTGLDAASVFGGSNFGFGLAGLGGYGVSRLVGNGSTASSIGGTLGGMAGYGLTAAGSALSGTALGATIGSVFPVVGTLVGALIGTLIGNLLSGSQGDKSPDLQVTPTGVALRPDEIRTTGSGGTNVQSLFVPSPFGGLSYTTKHDAFGSMEDAQAFAAALSAVGTIETALADMVGTEKTDQIAAALSDVLGDAMIKLAEDPGEWESGLEDFLATRFDTAFEIIGGQMQKVYLSIAEGAADAAAATVDLFGALRALADVQQTYGDLVEAQNRTLYEAQRLHADALSELIAGYQGGLAATQDLTLALGEQTTLQLQLFAQIDSAIAAVDSVLGGTIEKLTLDLMGSDAERYAYLRSQAEGLAASLTGINDPAEIERVVREINSLTQQGLGLLTPEQLQGGMGAEFLDFLTGVQDLADSQLELTRQQTLAQGELIQQQADVAIAQLEAAERLSAAADAIIGAASKLASQPIVVQVNNPDSQALRPI